MRATWGKGGGVDRTHLIIVGRSSEMPHPCTCTSLGKPMGSSISGRNMPLFPTSTHLFSIGWKAKISSDGCYKSC